MIPRLRAIRNISGAALCGAFLLACAQAERPGGAPAPADWDARVAALQGFERWELQGRVGVRVAQEGGQMSLQWRHAGADDALDFSGPLGKGLFAMTVDANGARARDDQGRWHRAADAETLIYELTGWRIPLHGLRYWVRGVPAPGSPVHIDWTDDGNARTFEQDGWTVAYREFASAAERVLPRRLALTRAVAGEPAIEIKLVIQQWRAL